METRLLRFGAYLRALAASLSSSFPGHASANVQPLQQGFPAAEMGFNDHFAEQHF